MYDKDAPLADKKVFDLGVPVLGICYGLQFMVYALGGKVRPQRSASTATPKLRFRNRTRGFSRDCPSSCRLDVAW